MEKHFQRLRRSKRDAATPIIVPPPTSSHILASTPAAQNPSSASPMSASGKPPGTPPSNTLPLPVASKPPRKLSPFRGFHLRSSHKRARDSPPSSIPQSPTLATGDRPRTAHVHTTSEKLEIGLDGAGDGQPTKKVRMPRFLELSEKGTISSSSTLLACRKVLT
jgi:protein-tyrosine phosphatase